MDARRRWGLKNSIRRAANALLGSGDADEAFDLVVIRSQVIVGDRPVGADTVASIGLEVIIGEAQRNAAVMVGPASENPGTEPLESAAFGASVGLAIQLPAAGMRREPAERAATVEIAC